MQTDYRVGVDLGGTKIELAVLDSQRCCVYRERLPTPQHDYTATLHSIETLIDDAEKHLLTRFEKLGIGTPGSLSTLTGTMKNCNSTCLNGRPLLADLTALLNRSIHLANDANCFVLSEAVDGAASNASFVFGVIIGTGVGGGLVYQKKLWQGGHHIAGEWGHNRMPDNGITNLAERRCYCGRSNCIETFLSGPGLSQTLDELFNLQYSAKSMAEIYSAADKNHADYHAIATCWQLYCQQLALALSQVINIVDPDAIVLGGGLSNMPILYKLVPVLWQPYVFNDEVSTPLLQAQHGDSSGVLGAAWLG